MGEKERRERTQSFSLRSMELHWSVFVGPRTKVHRIYERYALVPRIRDFSKDPRKEMEIEVIGFRKLPTRSFTLQEVGILPTLVLVPTLIYSLRRAQGGVLVDTLVRLGKGTLLLGEVGYA